MVRGVSDEIALGADFRAGDELAPATQVRGEFGARREGGVRAAGSDTLALPIRAKPNACGRVHVDAKVMHGFLDSG